MSVTEAEKALILDELSFTKDYQKIARRLGLPTRVVRDLDITENRTHAVSDDGYGRPEMRKYTVATRHVDAAWSISPEVNKAKADYDAGLVEICTGRDGFKQILYAIPRQEPDLKRVPYFSRKFGD